MPSRRALIIAAASAVVLALAGAALYRLRRPEGPATIPAAAAGAPIGPIEGVPYYLQGDPRWGAEPVGGSGEPMAAVGCTVTCLAMGLSAAGVETDPLALCRGLKDGGGFTGNGYVVWGAVETAAGGRARVELPPLGHETIARELEAGRPVIAKIMLRDAVQHWVLIVGRRDGQYMAMDPLNGARELVPLGSLTSNIHAIRVLRAA